MDDTEDVRRLRDEYESALDEAEAKRAEYHRAIKKMHLAGVPLRDIAEQLGISHQRVHQIVTGESPPAKRRRAKAIGGVALLTALVVATIGGAFALTHRGPFTPVAQGPIARNVVTIPRVTGLTIQDAQRVLAASDICVESISASGNGGFVNEIQGQAPAAGSLLTIDSGVALEIPGPAGGVTMGATRGVDLSIRRPSPSCAQKMQVFGASVTFGKQFVAYSIPSSGGRIVMSMSHEKRMLINLFNPNGATVLFTPDVPSGGTSGPDLTHFAS